MRLTQQPVERFAIRAAHISLGRDQTPATVLRLSVKATSRDNAATGFLKQNVGVSKILSILGQMLKAFSQGSSSAIKEDACA